MEQFYFVFDTYEEAAVCLPQFESDQAAKLRKESDDARHRSNESWERSDTDGCVTQWCSDITAAEKLREAELANHGYLVVRPALMDIKSGEIVAACVHMMQSKFHYGTDYLWKVYRPTGRFGNNGKEFMTEWVRDAKRESTFTKKGLRKVFVLAPGKMYSRSPGNHLPEGRGLSGLASYHGKFADIDFEASGLPM